MTAISLVPLLLIVALFFVAPTLLVLWLAFAAIRRKNWGGLAVLAFTAGALLCSVLMLGLSFERRIDSDFGGIPRLERMSAEASVAAPTPPQPPAAEIASDEELAAVASAPPKIELDSEIIVGDKAEDAKSHHPDWIDAHLGENQKLIVSGPFTTKESCETDTQKQLASWIGSQYGGGPDGASGTTIDVTPLIKSQHATTRETSVGEMHFLYTLAEVDPEAEAQIAKTIAESAAQVARKRGVRAVSFAGVGLLSLVALAYVVLRSGGRKATSKPTS